MSLRISADLELPLDLAGEATAILGKRGSGKTNTATVLVEELVRAGVQTVILDPVGAWWGLRSNAAGDGPGLEIPRLGGQHGDVPLEQTAGALIADVAIDSRQSLLIDLSDFPTKAAVARFVTDFAERLYRRKRSDSVLHLVLEEADTFAPQRVKGSERMQGAIEQIVRRGRSRGLGVTLITQRSAVLSKDVLTQADVLIVMRTTGPHDLRAIREWVDSRGDERGAGVLESLPALATGEGWIWNPEHDILGRTQFRARETFDSSRTPRAGEIRVEPEEAAPIDIASLGEQIKATAERVKAEDPKALRKRITELERDLKARPSETVTETIEKIVEVPTPVFNGEVETLEKVMAAMSQMAESFGVSFAAAAAVIEKAAGEVNAAVTRAKGVADAKSAPARADRSAEPQARPDRTRSRSAPEAAPAARSDGDVVLGGGEEKILRSLVAHFPMKVTRAQLGTLSGYSYKGGTFAKYFGILKREGLLDETGGEISVTDAGLAYFGEERPEPMSPDEVLAMWRGALEGGPRRLLDELVSVHPDTLTREELGERTGYESSGGTFAKYLSILRRNDLVEGRHDLRASDAFFIE